MKKSNRKLIIIIMIVFFIILFTPIIIEYNYYPIITPIKTKQNMINGELLSIDKIYLGRKERIFKKHLDEYITIENYRDYLDNKTYLNNNIRKNNNLKLEDIKKGE